MLALFSWMNFNPMRCTGFYRLFFYIFSYSVLIETQFSGMTGLIMFVSVLRWMACVHRHSEKDSIQSFQNAVGRGHFLGELSMTISKSVIPRTCFLSLPLKTTFCFFYSFRLKAIYSKNRLTHIFMPIITVVSNKIQ